MQANINPVHAEFAINNRNSSFLKIEKKEKKLNTSWITAVRLLVTLLLAMV
jgi:hypothetical protein